MGPKFCVKEKCKYFCQVDFCPSLFFCSLDDYQTKKKKDEQCRCIVETVINDNQKQLDEIRRYADRLIDFEFSPINTCCDSPSYTKLFLWDSMEDYEEGYRCEQCKTHYNLRGHKVNTHKIVREQGKLFGSKCLEID